MLGVILVLIWGLTRSSRLAAVLLFVFYLFNVVLTFLETPSLVGLGISLIILFFLAGAIKGAFDYQALLKNEDPDYRPTKKWMWVVFTPLVVLLGFFVLTALLSKWDIIPPTYVKFSQEITQDDRDALQELGLISTDTVVLGFYSHGFFSVKEGGVVMTEQALLVYLEEDEELYADQLLFEEIDWVKQLIQGSGFEDSLYQVAGKETYKGFQFGLSTENNGDTVFIQMLENKINPPPPPEAMPMPEF
jgi:hypothetical protein